MKLQKRTIHGLILALVFGFIVLGNRNFQASDLLLVEPVREILNHRIEPLYFYSLVVFVACLVGLLIRLLKGTFFEWGKDNRQSHAYPKPKKPGLPPNTNRLQQHLKRQGQKHFPD